MVVILTPHLVLIVASGQGIDSALREASQDIVRFLFLGERRA
ncbi:MAG: hypothetical protein Q8K82_24825 [Gemmatimonadaceae bacterium]|nr:hypothetical protein [Gemmatimonadaceae bacterium]